MFELIPSQYMRECYRELNFTFTDFQKATLIWNSPGKKKAGNSGCTKGTGSRYQRFLHKKTDSGTSGL